MRLLIIGVLGLKPVIELIIPLALANGNEFK
jgi:hypothetical protein